MTMQLDELYKKALNFEYLTKEEGMFLFEHAPLNELSYVANELRKKQVPHGKVTVSYTHLTLPTILRV